MIDRDIEKTLNLSGMKIDREDPVDPRYGDQVGDQLCGNRDPRLVLPVLSCITVIGDDGRDLLRRSALEGIDENQQLHNVVVDRLGGRLNDKNIAAADIFIDLDEDLSIAEGGDDRMAERNTQIVTDLFGEDRIRITRKKLQPSHRKQPSS